MLNWLPENISSFGKNIDGIMYLIYYVVGAWFLLAEGILIYFLLRYRRKSHPTAAYAPGKTGKAMAWVLIPVALVLLCDIAIDAKGTAAWDELKVDMPDTQELVRIEGRQFAWNFRHAGSDGQLDTADDVVTNGQLFMKVNDKVKFELISKDVIHSFFVPNLRFKQDAVPGRKINGWFDATKTGTYGISCAELCGGGHSYMQASLVVLSPEDYEKWLKK